MQKFILLEGTLINTKIIVITGMISTWPCDKSIARRVINVSSIYPNTC
jgi:hypothetical protein